ncbi:hypothetical protein F5X68DRAFT_69519 [Plectosphaerella plurivora]|uniref:Uncharacterized protein n=1 Tax=Plectosphaerella plurivora TaxID=936078 RepID=A0A9P8VHD2_9PEZI|nr:hypothetical protein F5X68DRAFT_69519 [Plectosphaerella plurivora]
MPAWPVNSVAALSRGESRSRLQASASPRLLVVVPGPASHVHLQTCNDQMPSLKPRILRAPASCLGWSFVSPGEEMSYARRTRGNRAASMPPTPPSPPFRTLAHGAGSSRSTLHPSKPGPGPGRRRHRPECPGEPGPHATEGQNQSLGHFLHLSDGGHPYASPCLAGLSSVTPPPARHISDCCGQPGESRQVACRWSIGPPARFNVLLVSANASCRSADSRAPPTSRTSQISTALLLRSSPTPSRMI